MSAADTETGNMCANTSAPTVLCPCDAEHLFRHRPFHHKLSQEDTHWDTLINASLRHSAARRQVE